MKTFIFITYARLIVFGAVYDFTTSANN